jgi:hypothetical protein
MDYIHIRNLEKYHPKYIDRDLKWCKLYFSTINGDPEFEMLCEIDQWRFFKFVMLELQAKKPIPIDKEWLTKKGFDLKKRPISLTLQMLQGFIEPVEKCDVEKRREDIDKRVDVVTEKPVTNPPPLDFLKTLKTNSAYKHINIENELAKMDGWLLVHKGRQKTQRFIVNWLNKIDKPFEIEKPKIRQLDPLPEPTNEERQRLGELIKDTVKKMGGKK